MWAVKLMTLTGSNLLLAVLGLLVLGGVDSAWHEGTVATQEIVASANAPAGSGAEFTIARLP